MLMKTVFALIVTYNRKECLLELISSLFKQTFMPQYILIFDNFSSDGTEQALLDNNLINFDNQLDTIYCKEINNVKVLYYRNHHNSGGSGGFSSAFKLSMQFDYDYLWVMDDDVLATPTCLEKLLMGVDNDHQVVVPNRTCDLFTDNPIVDIDLHSPFKMLDKRKKKLNQDIFSNVDVVDITFEGPLFSRKVIEQVGFPDENYFIIYDDSDYGMRCKKVTNIKFIHDAYLNRQLPLLEKNNKFNWKQYYYYRNTVFFLKKYGSNFFVRNFSVYVFWIILTLKFLLKGKFYNIRIIAKAFWDGLKKVRGKSIEPGSM